MASSAPFLPLAVAARTSGRHRAHRSESVTHPITVTAVYNPVGTNWFEPEHDVVQFTLEGGLTSAQPLDTLSYMAAALRQSIADSGAAGANASEWVLAYQQGDLTHGPRHFLRYERRNNSPNHPPTDTEHSGGYASHHAAALRARERALGDAFPFERIVRGATPVVAQMNGRMRVEEIRDETASFGRLKHSARLSLQTDLP